MVSHAFVFFYQILLCVGQREIRRISKYDISCMITTTTTTKTQRFDPKSWKINDETDIQQRTIHIEVYWRTRKETKNEMKKKEKEQTQEYTMKPVARFDA